MGPLLIELRQCTLRTKMVTHWSTVQLLEFDYKRLKKSHCWLLNSSAADISNSSKPLSLRALSLVPSTHLSGFHSPCTSQSSRSSPSLLLHRSFPLDQRRPLEIVIPAFPCIPLLFTYTRFCSYPTASYHKLQDIPVIRRRRPERIRRQWILLLRKQIVHRNCSER